MPIQNIGSDVIKAYLHGVQQRQHHEEMAKKFELETEQAAEHKRQYNESLKQSKAQFDAEHSLRKAMNDLQHTTTLSNLQRNSAETGLTPPGGVESLSPTTTSEQDFNSLNDATQGMAPNQVRPGIQGPTVNRQISVPDVGSFTVPDAFSYARQKASLRQIGNQPDIDKAVGIAKGVEQVKQPGKMEIVNTKMANDLKVEDAKVKAASELQKQKDAAALIRTQEHNKGLIDAANARGRVAGLKNRYLSPEEADKMNVPLGSTIEDVKGQPVVRKLAPEEQKRFDTIQNLSKLVTNVEDLGTKTNFSAIGSLGRGSLRQAGSSVLGIGSDDEREFRSQLGNFDGMISELRAGKVITANEESRLKRYVPQLNSSPEDFISKLKTFKATLQDMTSTLLQPAARRGAGINNPVDNLVKKHGGN